MHNYNQKILSVSMLTLGMAIFALTVFSHIDTWSKKKKAETKLLVVTLAWQDYVDYHAVRQQNR